MKFVKKPAQKFVEGYCYAHPDPLSLCYHCSGYCNRNSGCLEYL
ncbi:hypothetical protein GCM10008904_00680 [Paraclostridium ghonii]|uniref:Cys-rich peptide (Clo7bot family) n=1 Tax=Paraclostridium ghonii TaxID=29358 RepID=A0ABU0N482_9FIRM|nr:Clo7bot family Cys-rich peptide [Paeniclostridium ghonii]MDQ0557973.1 Cys-rich peptide (Clo7bot family) [Paeniclostridium ghonii]